VSRINLSYYRYHYFLGFLAFLAAAADFLPAAVYGYFLPLTVGIVFLSRLGYTLLTSCTQKATVVPLAFSLVTDFPINGCVVK